MDVNKNSITQQKINERKNKGYLIAESVQVSNTEYVLGINPNAPEPFVTWSCMGKEDYNYGHYFVNEESARRDLVKRVNSEKQYLNDLRVRNARSPKDKGEKER